MKKIALLSSHYIFSKRKAGFHFLAKEYTKLFDEVGFVTIRFSPLYFLSRNHLVFEDGIFKNIFSPIKKENLISFINFTPLHPTPKLGDTKIVFFLQKRIKEYLKTVDYIIFESNESLFFFEELKILNPKAKMIYRVSDDITVLDSIPSLIKEEEKIISKFDKVSTPSSAIYERLKNLSNKNNVFLEYHGIDKKIFNNCNINPYEKGSINLVFVGQSHFDEKFLKIAAKLFPDFYFHIIGDLTLNINLNNVKVYGHMPFEKIIPYVKFADVGLVTRYGNEKLLKTLSDSLKVLQYSYCKLPIIAPKVIKSDRKNWFTYELNENSIKKAIKDALAFDKENFDNSDIYTWEELSKRLIDV